MSVKSRRILGAATAFVWAAWLAAEWARADPDIHTGPIHEVVAIGLRLLVIVASLASIVAWVVSPVLATARVALMAAARTDQHDDVVVGRPTAGDTVVPIRRYRSFTDS